MGHDDRPLIVMIMQLVFQYLMCKHWISEKDSYGVILVVIFTAKSDQYNSVLFLRLS